MWKALLLCATIVMVLPNTESAKRYRKRGAYGTGSGAGAYAGAGGYGGGYTGGYVGGYGGDDYDDGGVGFGFVPEFGAGFIDPYLFHQQLTAQILSQHAAQNNVLSSTYSSGDASATADASSLPDDPLIQQQIAHNRRQSLYNKGYKSNRYAPSYASASGSIGPGGYYQSASIHPSNSNSPNIVNRFTSSSYPNGFKGVSVSSFSSSSDIDGKRSSHRGAQTTVNDNGKITSYSVHS